MKEKTVAVLFIKQTYNMYFNQASVIHVNAPFPSMAANT
jgi:hypothetical protein